MPPEFEQRVRGSFARQGIMAHIGAEMTQVRRGHCEIRMPFRPEVSQQKGLFHGGVIGTISDSAGGYAAFSMMPERSSVLTVEYKINFIKPALGAELIARGDVIRCGRTLAIAKVDAFVVRDDGEHLCATAQQTLMCLPSTSDEVIS